MNIIIAIVLALHGFIHLIGTAVYLKMTTIDGMPYKTTLLGGRWDLGETGTTVFGLLWGVATIAFVSGAVGLLTHAEWAKPVLIATTIFSLLLTTLDWSLAFAGVIVNVIILIGIFLWPRIAD